MAITPTNLTLAGTMQKWITAKLMKRPMEEWRTALVNAPFTEKITFPKNGGQYGEWRKFSEVSIKTESGNDSPYTYLHDEDVADGDVSVLTATTYQCPLEVHRGAIAVNQITADTDLIPLMNEAKEKMVTYCQRYVHRVSNDRMIRAAAQNVLTGVSGAPTLTTYVPFRTIYCGNVGNFANLTKANVHALDDYKRAASMLSNKNVPPSSPPYYDVVIPSAVSFQLLSDPIYRDVVKRHQDMTQQAEVNGALWPFGMCKFTVEDDPYRCILASGAGALATRKDSGEVFVSHVFGKNAHAAMKLGGAWGSIPRFKVQDISITGVRTTIGFTFLYAAFPIDIGRGMNVAGCSNWDQTLDDIEV